MQKKGKQTRLMLIMTTIIALIFSVSALSSDEKKVEPLPIPQTEIQYHHFNTTVESDGNLLVEEEIDYDFNNINGFIRDYRYDVDEEESIEMLSVRLEDGTTFEKRDSGTVGESGIYTFFDNNEEQELKIFYPTEGKLKVFITYRVRGLIRQYDDMQELYWKFYDTMYDTLPSKNVKVSVHLPSAVSKSDMFLFGHGDLEGKLTIENEQLVTVIIPFFPEKTFGEVRLLLPTKPITGFTGPTYNGPQFNDALGYELQQSAITNEKIKAIEKAEEQKNVATDIIRAMQLFITLLAGFLGFRSYKKIYESFDKEIHNTELDYYREVSTDYGPAVAALVADPERKPNQTQLTAVLFQLYMKKQINIELIPAKQITKTKEEVMITVLPRTDTHLFPEEVYLYDWLKNFGGEKQFSYKAFTCNEKGYTSESQSKAFIWNYEIFLRKIELSYDALGYREYPGRFENGGVKSGHGWLIVGLIVLIVACFKFKVDGSIIFISTYIIVLMFGQMTILSNYKLAAYRYTKKGAEEHAKMNGLKNFLNDFSTLDEASPSRVHLWEKYFVYGLSLGVTSKALKELYNKLPISQEELSTSHYTFHIISSLLASNELNRYNQSMLVSNYARVKPRRATRSASTSKTSRSTESNRSNKPRRSAETVKPADVSRKSGNSSTGSGGGFSGGGGYGGGGGGGRSF